MIVAIIPMGSANKAVGKKPRVIPNDCKYQVVSITIIEAKAIKSP